MLIGDNARVMIVCGFLFDLEEAFKYSNVQKIRLNIQV